jgi:HD superfamily phosphohydrolase
VVKLALGPKEAPDLTFSTWETILAEIIVGDAFGADRMDYLLRDSHHAGVAYGRFDHFRLIDTLRILPPPPTGSGKTSPQTGATAGASGSAALDASREPALGILDGGLHSAEALMLARYFMFTQLYFHPVRRIYDIHLKDFLMQTLPGGKYPSAVNEHLEISDNEVTASILKASRDLASAGHDPARRIAKPEHFKLFYSRHPDDLKLNLEPGKAIYQAAKEEFGEENVRWDCLEGKSRVADFPVMPKDGPISSALDLSEPLLHLPAASFDYVFVNPSLRGKARAWLDAKRSDILKPKEDSKHGAP